MTGGRRSFSEGAKQGPICRGGDERGSAHCLSSRPLSVIPRESGVSSTPRPIDSITDVSGILGRPVPSPPRLRRAMNSLGRRSFSEGGKPGDDSQVSNFKQRQTHFRDLAAQILLESCSLVRLPLKAEGAGNTGRSMRPIAACAMVVAKRTRVSRSHRIHPAFPAQWFTAYFALSPATGLSCHRRPRCLART
jgi:hypothetical protein